MKKLLVFFLFLCCTLASEAQDKHFSQFYAAPGALNPALTGFMDGRYRVSGIYRNQWNNALGQPYSTFSGAVDVKFDIELNSQYKDGIGVGLNFVSDKVPGIDFSTNQINLNAAFHKGLNFNETQFLSLGFQAGLAQRNVNYEDLTFNDEFNGLDGYTNATNEDLPENNFPYSDYSVGLNYAFAPGNRVGFYAGGAMHHIFSPLISFYRTEENLSDHRLLRKYSAHVSGQFPVSEKISFLPKVFYALQGPHSQINSGINLRYLLNDWSNNSLYLGTQGRLVSNEDNLGFDALIFLVALDLGSVSMGFSYDYNLKSSTYSAIQSAFEVSVTYNGDYDNDSILCPSF